jgi:glutathione synthetase
MFCLSHLSDVSDFPQPAPVALLPSAVPRAAFERARDLTTTFHDIKRRVVADADFLESVLAGAAEEDEFLRRLLALHRETQRVGVRQSIALSICRTDYMLHRPADADASTEAQLLQVEMNMISAGFTNLGPKTSALHRYVTARHTDWWPQYAAAGNDSLPANDASRIVCDSMHTAFRLYGVPSAVVVMVVQPNEKNAYDQRVFEYYLGERGVLMRRYTLAQIAALAHVDDVSGVMRINGEEVALAYFRAGYTPRDYPSEAEWRARHLLEASRVIKSPTVAFQLSGLKKVQQVLADRAVLRRFVDDDATVERVLGVCAGLWALGDGRDQAVVDAAIADNCKHYVLKPQREGGGNNLYEADATAALRRMSERERRAYILMSRIETPSHRCYVVRDAVNAEWIEATSELGFYGALLVDGSTVVHNRYAGILLRTKSASENDGGVSAGVAVLDSPHLV